MTPLFGMAKGDVFSTAKLRKGLENMRKLYGDFGFIDFVAEPSFDPVPDSGLMDMSLRWMKAINSSSGASTFPATPPRATK